MTSGRRRLPPQFGRLPARLGRSAALGGLARLRQALVHVGRRQAHAAVDLDHLDTQLLLVELLHPRRPEHDPFRFEVVLRWVFALWNNIYY